jgi:hypothetical protein
MLALGLLLLLPPLCLSTSVLLPSVGPGLMRLGPEVDVRTCGCLRKPTDECHVHVPHMHLFFNCAGITR